MKNYLVVLEGIDARGQVREFLTGVRLRSPDVRFYILVPAKGDDGPGVAWPEAARHASASLEALRTDGLPVIEAIVCESGRYAMWEELRRPDRDYACALRFTPFRRGMHVERLTPRRLSTPTVGLTA